MSLNGTLLPSMAGGMLRLAPMTALARCVCEIDGMAEGQLWAVHAGRRPTCLCELPAWASAMRQWTDLLSWRGVGRPCARSWHPSAP